MAENKVHVDGEIWKDISGYKGKYQVSTFGRVRSRDRYVKHRYGKRRFIKGKILKPLDNGIGYMQVSLSDNSKQRRVLIHRLVMAAFDPLGPDDGNLEPNHIDGDKSNNRLDNLEWITHSENIKHGYDNGLIPPHGRRAA